MQFGCVACLHPCVAFWRVRVGGRRSWHATFWGFKRHVMNSIWWFCIYRGRVGAYPGCLRAVGAVQLFCREKYGESIQVELVSLLFFFCLQIVAHWSCLKPGFLRFYEIPPTKCNSSLAHASTSPHTNKNSASLGEGQTCLTKFQHSISIDVWNGGTTRPDCIGGKCGGGGDDDW